MCKNILNIYKKGDIEQLKRKLEENEGTIYNNKSSQYIPETQDKTWRPTIHMRTRISRRTGNENHRQGQIQTPENDPIVVMTRDKGSLEERILRTMRKLSKENDQDYSETFTDWETPKITWINGVPDVGKQRGSFKNLTKRDCIVTATIEAAEDLKENWPTE
ncbi:hypothetical protein EVAR_48121_1 [Eumeta japonica]|uniref:Uncharacterized protein n=1 Tax=Eumeta variegata TaxID=151549 RepID=A0A4C2A8N2_EUMVA|nr:hypothetical protein EVAR_48121_1 [Eumeta japonica]